MPELRPGQTATEWRKRERESVEETRGAGGSAGKLPNSYESQTVRCTKYMRNLSLHLPNHLSSDHGLDFVICDLLICS